MASRPGLIPGEPVPDFEVALVDGGRWQLSERSPERFTLIDFYRGRHCPRCHLHILDLKHKLPRLRERGVEAIAISMDAAPAARETVGAWGLQGLAVGYGLEEDVARSLGLYISQKIGNHEPGGFSEPAMLLINPDRSLYCALYSTTPFVRFHYADLLEGLDAVIARNYPARGGA